MPSDFFTSAIPPCHVPLDVGLWGSSGEIDIHQPSFDAENLREEIQMGNSVCGLVKRAFPIGLLTDMQPLFCSCDCLLYLLNGRCCLRSTPVPENFRYVAL